MHEEAKKNRFTVKERLFKTCFKLIRFSEKVFFIFPIKARRIIFQSYGHAVGYTCNPKYICEYLKKHCPGEYELIWAFQDPEAFKDIEGITPVKHKSLKWFYYRFTSKVVVLNEGPSAYIAKRKGQYLIQTWHGGGAYKKVGFARGDITPLWEWIYKTTGEDIDLFLASGEIPGRTSAWETYHYKGEILPSGSPRNDILLDSGEREEASRSVRERLGIKDAFVVLYAPTFRNLSENLHDVFSFRELKEALERRVQKEVVFLLRAHRYNDGTYQTDIKTIDVTAYPDMQELLCASDMLITDYSSCMWDFALLKRPCLLYVPDLEQYDGERGFFTRIEDWPGLICHTAQELYETAASYNEAVCTKKAEEHLKLLGSYETGTATAQVCDRIRQVVRGIS